MTSARPIPIDPVLPSEAAPFVDQFRLGVATCRCQAACLGELVRDLLGDGSIGPLPTGAGLPTRLFFEVVEDLVGQGWCFEHRDGKLFALPPEALGGDSADQREVKLRLRAGLVAARNEQLREEATLRFVLDMERPRRWRGRQVSVLNLFVSSQDLATDLRRRLETAPGVREQLLQNAVQPYLQRATDDRDRHTNLRLIDIWRYCRYTWSLPLSPQPGRQMLYLVRDAARPFHPVIGIGALGNSVVQITNRDRAIGWTIDAFTDMLDAPERLSSVEDAIQEALGETQWDDLLSPDQVASPTDEIIAELESIAAKGRPLHVAMGRSGISGNGDEAEALLYRRKRAKELARLLRARRIFNQVTATTPNPRERIQALVGREDGRRAIATALRSIKKQHIGSSMMDITTCGAVPPYGEVLGGKLVSLLMASPQVVADYRDRYGEMASEIASRMKGEQLVRPADLVLLGTTSLYHVGSSQYNRLHAPTARGEVRFVSTGTTKGFGSIHISQRTYRTIQELLGAHPGLDRETSAFGGGVNYKMRTIEAGLSHIGLGRLQRHASPRLVYLVPLTTNWREYLTGQTKEARSIYENLWEPGPETEALVRFWKERWFLPRIQRPQTLRNLRACKNNVRVSAAIDSGVAISRSAAGAGAEVDSDGAVGGGAAHLPIAVPLSWRSLADLVDKRASFAERLTSYEFEALHIPTRLDAGVLELVRAGRRVYLTGNPGDGKTHLIRRLEQDLVDLDLETSSDASAEDPETFVAKVRRAADPVRPRPALLAINEGPLRRLLPSLPAAEASALAEQLNKPYVYGDADPIDEGPVLVNLGLRQSLARPLLEGALQLLQHRVDYSDAPTAVQRNYAQLSRPRVRDRLARLLELVARSGAHVTMHQLFGFIGFVVTAGEAGVASARTPCYADLVFDRRNPLAHWLEPLDPVQLTYPLADMWLWDGDPRGRIEWLETPSGDPPSRTADPEQAWDAFRTLKRRFFFEATDGAALLELLPEDLKRYYELVAASGSQRDTAIIRVIEVLGYLVGEAAGQTQDVQIRIWTGLRYEALGPPSAFVSSQAVPVEKVDLRVPRLRPVAATLLDFEPTHIRLEVAPASPERAPIGLEIDLELWRALMRLKRGMPHKHHDPLVARRLNTFMSRLAAEYEPIRPNYVQLRVRDVDLNRTYEVAVSLDTRRYHW